MGATAVIFGLGSNFIYLRQILRRAIKPHLFSWIVWGILGLIAFAAQQAGSAGPGSWAVGVSSVVCLVIAALSLFYGEKKITRSDWAAFIFALTAIPAWIATKNPLWAVIIVSIIDAAAFYPTFRKSWEKPQEESLSAFIFYALQMLLACFAAEKASLTTTLYPAVIFILNMTLVTLLFFRRREGA